MSQIDEKALLAAEKAYREHIEGRAMVSAIDTLIGLDLYGVRITASKLLPPEFFVVDDWSLPKQNHHPEWLSIWAIGENSLIAHPTVINKLSDEWKRGEYDKR